MVNIKYVGWRTMRDDTLPGQHGDSRRQPGQRIQIMSHHHHGKPQLLLQHSDQLHEIVGEIGIESSGRFVEYEQLRFKCQRTRELG